MSSKSENAKIISAMQRAGVPKFAWRSTLPKLGQEGLREWVNDLSYVGDDFTENMYIHPSQASHSTLARNVAYTVGKELVLRGERVCVMTMMQFASCLGRDPWANEETIKNMRNSVMLILIDFYVKGIGSPFNSRETYYIRETVTERMNAADQGVIIHSSSAPTQAKEYYGENFMQEVASLCTVYPVEGGK